MERFFIDESCTEDSDLMPQTRGGRHCAKCDHIVIDARGMTREAFARYVQQSDGKVCAQIRATDEGEAILRDPPPASTPRAPRVRYAGGLVLLSALSAGGCGEETVPITEQALALDSPPVPTPSSAAEAQLAEAQLAEDGLAVEAESSEAESSEAESSEAESSEAQSSEAESPEAEAPEAPHPVIAEGRRRDAREHRARERAERRRLEQSTRMGYVSRGEHVE